MALIYDSTNFLVQSAEFPLVDRNDGGHITIDPKFKVSTRQELSPKKAIELMRLTLITGEAMTIILNRHGVDIGRVNYQDNGNWAVFNPEGPQLHYHVYGRAKSAVYQKYGDTLFMPHRKQNPAYYEMFQPLTIEDITAIKEYINELFQEERYSNDQWCL
jgi:diadenosine tetraphosphate (Ap4A) HIT family hydrolase